MANFMAVRSDAQEAGDAATSEPAEAIRKLADAVISLSDLCRRLEAKVNDLEDKIRRLR